jgi:beta-N-acetylhexosaminidase
MNAVAPLMIDVAGPALMPEDRRRLLHPLVGGVILFARNFVSRPQLAELVAGIRALRPLLIAVDHEGGRVQRFRDGFTRLPPMAALGRLFDRDAAAGLSAARQMGLLTAVELRSVGIDLSFSPVLDLAYGHSAVIGDRAFHRQPAAVAALATAYVDGLHFGGLAACGKHFPGHGHVAADSHLEVPVDERPLSELGEDMWPFREVPLDAVMPAHVVYPAVDDRPAGFSPKWIALLREELRFPGVLFSDDLSMAGAGTAGGPAERVEAAWQGGCDMLLLCNDQQSVDAVLASWQPSPRPATGADPARLQALPFGPAAQRVCTASACYHDAVATAARLAVA